MAGKTRMTSPSLVDLGNRGRRRGRGRREGEGRRGGGKGEKREDDDLLQVSALKTEVSALCVIMEGGKR